MVPFVRQILLALALVGLAGPSVARAQANSGCWNRAIESFDADASPQAGGDADFFSSIASKGNLTLVYATTASLREFPRSLYELRVEDGGGTGCSNSYLNQRRYFAPLSVSGAALAGLYSATKTYPDPESRFFVSSQSPTSDGLDAGSAYRYLRWPAGGEAGVAESVSSACFAAGGPSQQGACTSCINSRGYWLNPLVPHNDESSSAGVFSTNFLRFYPIKASLLRIAHKRLVHGSLAGALRKSLITQSEQTSDGVFGANGGMLNQRFLPSCTGGGLHGSQFAKALDTVRLSSAANPIAEMLFNGGYYNGNLAWAADYFSGDTRVNWSGNGGTSTTQNNGPCPGCARNVMVLFSDGRGDTANPFCKPDALGVLPGPCRAAATCTSRGMTVENDGNDYIDPSYAGLVTGPSVTTTNAGVTCAGDFADDVARWLYGTDAVKGRPGTNVSTYVIGLGTRRYNRFGTLDAIAAAGQSPAEGATAFQADDFETLEAAMQQVLTTVVTKSTSFSAAAVTAVQTRGSTFAFVPRFAPLQGSVWRGDLFGFRLFNEFSAGCTASDYGRRTPLNPDGDSSCTDVYLRDADDDFIGESEVGDFRKLDSTASSPPPAILPWPLRTPPQPARPVWDARVELENRARRVNAGSAAEARDIWTMHDADDDGVYETRLDFTVANAATLAPLLALGGVSGEFCSEFSAHTGASYVTEAACAADVIRFFHGQDVMRQEALNRTVPPPSPAYARPHILGDIFHSSPILVAPPSPQFLCDLGVTSQCLFSLYSPRLSSNGVDGYLGFQSANLHRQQFLLVGANDGMLHAFNAGNDRTGDDPETPGVEASTNHYFDPGTGRELWAYIPPVLLPKLKRYVRGSRHELYVDGTPMVRDVWADGSGATVTVDRTKQADEFHTVAVIGLREGGREWNALDVTDPLNPRFLWGFPRPGTTRHLASGETWNDFAPSSPPIGPVAVADPDGVFSVKGVRAAERYVVALGGGYDSAGLRGRSIDVLDVWTGRPVYRFARDNPGTAAMAQPLGAVPAVPALVDTDSDALFDTALVGDTRGQIWTLALGLPGRDLDDDGLFDNWFGARAFQQFRGLGLDRPSPFFQISAAALLPTGELRVYVGSGDRDQIRAPDGGTCGLSHLNACVRKGCSVDVEFGAHSIGTHALTGRTSLSGSGTGYETDTYVPAGTLSTPSSSCSDPLRARFAYSIDCGGAALSSTNEVSCDWGATTPGVDCPVRTGLELGSAGATLAVPSPVGMEHSRLYSVRIFDGGSRQPFTDSTMALAYDGARLSDASLVDADAATASAGGNGFYVRHSNSIDERTASGALVLAGCVVWNTLTPSNTASGCGAIPVAVGRLYQADAITGARSCGTIDTAARFRERPAIMPPPMPTPVVAVNPSTGSVAYGGLSLEPGAPPLPISVGESSLLGVLHWLEVPRELHECRHEGRCQ
jgi:type IV pilus assembly protein PilY1